MPAGDEIHDLVNELREPVTLPVGASEADILEEERRLGKKLPPGYRRLLGEVGPFRVGELSVLGVGDALPIRGASIFRCWQAMVALGGSSVPDHLVPVAALGREVYACLDLSSGSERVVLWELLTPPDEQVLSPIAEDFVSFLRARLPDEGYRQRSLDVFAQYTCDFHDEYLQSGRLPRNDVWRPYRLCSQDIVIGLVVARHSLDDNCLLVDVCLAFDPREFEPNSGSKMTTVFLLSEAYKCGGSMEIRFGENVEGGRVPRCIRDLAAQAGLDLSHLSEARLSPSEARQLFLSVSDFSPSLRAGIDALADRGHLSRERACYVVHHGVWTRAELEAVVLGSPEPDAILAGDVAEEDRHLFLRRLQYARAAVLGGFLDRRLATRERMGESGTLDLEDDQRVIEIGFDAAFHAKTYLCYEPMVIPWLASGTADVEVDRLTAFVRARTSADMMLHFDEDLGVAAAHREGTGETTAILVPRDFDYLPAPDRQQFSQKASTSGVLILVCPETVFSLDLEARRRLQSSRILRQ